MNLPDRHSFLNAPRYLLMSALLILLPVSAFIDFYFSGLARRTFVFYDFDSGIISVEDRMSVSGRNRSSREDNIRRYAEEAVLGPVSHNSLPLFPDGTRLVSLLYRNGTVYANLSAQASLSPAEGGEVLKNMETLRSGIKRNFSFVNDVRFFIAGRAVYTDNLRRETETGI